MEKNLASNTQQSAEKMNAAPTVNPYMDIYESPSEIVMLADLPGVRQEDLELNFENNEITIRASQRAANESWRPHFREAKPLHFERGFKLPSGLDIANITADFSAGVLTITLPKSESERPHTIKINRKSA